MTDPVIDTFLAELKVFAIRIHAYHDTLEYRWGEVTPCRIKFPGTAEWAVGSQYARRERQDYKKPSQGTQVSEVCERGDCTTVLGHLGVCYMDADALSRSRA
jgi:hypothetical protein